MKIKIYDVALARWYIIQDSTRGAAFHEIIMQTKVKLGPRKKEASDLLARYDVQQNAQNTHESLFMNPNFDTGFVLCTAQNGERDMHHRIVAKTSVKKKNSHQ